MAKNKSQKSSPKNDERNIVGPDQVDIQDLEDQAFMFWEKYKVPIIGGVAFIFAVFVGYQGLKFMQKSALESLKEGYQEAAASSETKATWAKDNDGKPLSGFAFKELGDEAFEAGDFQTAEDYYRNAAESASAPIDQAATIGLAVTLIAQDKASEAKPLLQKIADDPTSLAQAEAQYRLAYIANKEGDTETARALVETISDEATFWKSRALSIERKLPEA